MPERFTYQPGAKEELLQQARRRLWLWLLFLSPFWGIGLHSVFSGQGWLGLMIALGASAMVAFFEALLRRFASRTRELVEHTLEYEGSRLR